MNVPQAEEQNPYDTPEYQAFVEEMAKDCKCYPLEVRPCDGLLAGGPCDRMGQDSDFWEVRHREEDGSD